jgi:phenylpropionate dioxygenase-like ring-hydroxylating dioxygenase large terminal subunit
MALNLPGEVVDTGLHIPEIDYSHYRMKFPTLRFHCRDYAAREREHLWMRVWQIAGRADEIPEAGDWKVHTLFDQSYVLVRQKDGTVRGFVNACRHRGNAFCEGSGHSARFTCPYHNWSYGLDGQCLSVAKPDYDGPVEEFVGGKDELALAAISAECFAGFIFVNPDPDAPPLAEFLGEAADHLSAYKLDEMVPVGMNVREHIACNWKVVNDAFQEGYHVQGVHPELVPFVDLTQERCSFFGDHAVTTVPFSLGLGDEAGPEAQVEAYRLLPVENFPGLVEVMPHFEDLVTGYKGADGKLAFPEGITSAVLFQRAARKAHAARGYDVSRLTDNQLSDFQFWFLFPNVFIQIRAGESTVISSVPHPSGDPNRCIWQATALLWLPPEQRAAAYEPMREIAEDDHYPYFLALEQDYEQMSVQQRGLRNQAMEHMTLTRQEPKVIHFHSMLDAWVDGGAG